MESDQEYEMNLGEKAPSFTLKGTDGKNHALESFTKELLVVFFTCNHCPYAKAYEARIKDLSDEFEDEVNVVGINSNDAENYPEDSFESMKQRAGQEDFNFTYLRDETQEVAAAYGGECTPHFFLFDEERQLVYQGGFDDNWKEPSEVTDEYLKNAILEILDGEEVSKPLTNATGCSIKWKNN